MTVSSSLSNLLFWVAGAGVGALAAGGLAFVPGAGIAAIVVGAFGAVMALVAFLGLGRLARRLESAATTMEAVSKGDFEQRILHIRETGAIGALFHSANRLIDVTDAFVRESGAAMEAVAAGKFYRFIQEEGLSGHYRTSADRINAATAAMGDRVARFQTLTDDFEKTVADVVRTVAQASTGLNDTSGHLSGLARSTTDQVSGVAAATEQASANVQTVASAAEELSASILEINRQVRDASQTTETASKQAETANDLVNALASAAEEIGTVGSLITEIADQTNLLALNATIEAARAGEAGKGFAVVAGEVKNLANETGKATQRIQQQVTSIREATGNAVEAIRTIVSSIADVSGVTHSIATAVEQQSAATNEISKNVQEASAGTSEVARSTETVAQSANETGVAADQLQAAAGDLASQAGLLRGEVERYLEAARRAG